MARQWRVAIARYAGLLLVGLLTLAAPGTAAETDCRRLPQLGRSPMPTTAAQWIRSRSAMT